MNSYVITDCRISKEEELNFSNLGYIVLKCPTSPNLYNAVCGHPDMLLHLLDNENIIVHNDMDKSFIDRLKLLNFKIHLSTHSLNSKYPYDIILNCLNLKDIFVHKLKYTDTNLLSFIKNKKMININQGYTKCSTAIINDNAIITSDTGIATSLNNEGVDVLLLPPGDIILPGLDYGFIGGCCGLISKNQLAFYGNLNYYKYGYEVLTFLKKYDIEPIYLSNGKLIDRGSIFSFNRQN